MQQVDGHLNAARAGVASASQNWVQPFAHGSMRCVYFAPRGHDDQQPHSQDELYVVISGNGVLVRGSDRTAFNMGDTLFVAAGVEHHFVDFSDDFECWAIFWGPAGGESELLRPQS